MSRHGQSTHEESPHDVLAAEEFGMGTRDPQLHVEPPHDVLAAEEFGMGVGDPALRHDPLTLPEPVDDSPEPHDVLAAEEFAVPAGHPGARGVGSSGRAASSGGVAPDADAVTNGGALRRRGLALVGALAGVVALLMRKRH